MVSKLSPAEELRFILVVPLAVPGCIFQGAVVLKSSPFTNPAQRIREELPCNFSLRFMSARDVACVHLKRMHPCAELRKYSVIIFKPRQNPFGKFRYDWLTLWGEVGAREVAG